MKYLTGNTGLIALAIILFTPQVFARSVLDQWESQSQPIRLINYKACNISINWPISFNGGYSTQENLEAEIVSSFDLDERWKCSPVYNEHFKGRFATDKNFTVVIRDKTGKLAEFTGMIFAGRWTGIANFVDGEICNLPKDSDKQRGHCITKEQKLKDERDRRISQDEYERKVSNFRKKLSPGDESSSGLVLEVKGNLVKIQGQQCIQRDYDGGCRTYGAVEKWVKRNELYP